MFKEITLDDIETCSKVFNVDKVRKTAFVLFDNLLQDTCHKHAIKYTDERPSPRRLVETFHYSANGLDSL